MKGKEKDTNLGKEPYIDYHLHEKTWQRRMFVRTRTKLEVQEVEPKLD